MKVKNISTLILIIYMFSNLMVAEIVLGQENIKYKFDAVVVTASRIPAVNLTAPRSISVIDRQEIETLPVHSVQELLEYALGVDVRQRGPLGVQADISLRGGSMEQTLIMVNGAKINDAQTGHHNLNIPVNLNDIEKIEILKGPGSAVFGANAVNGVVNIITHPVANRMARFTGTYGENQFYDAGFSLAFPLAKMGQQFSYSKKRSDGYRENTDFDMDLFSYSSETELGRHKLSLQAGYLDKKFGANSFYSARFPLQWEQTKTAYGSIGSDLSWQKFSLNHRFYWRRNEDDFLLDRSRPEFYHNHHITNGYTAEIQASVRSRLGISVFGGELGQTEINSTNLGNHRRNRSGLFLEHRMNWHRFSAIPGFFIYHYSNWGWKAWPGLNLGLNISPRSQIYGSANQAFRIPTYTELYYKSPANAGDAALKPEQSITYEIGFKWVRHGWEGSLAAFRRQGTNLIDWVQFDQDGLWQALNFTEINSQGFEADVWLYPVQWFEGSRIQRINLNYSTLHSDKDTEGFQSKYVLDYLRHQFNAGVDLVLTRRLRQHLQFRYKERIGFSGIFLFDTKMVYHLKRSEIFLEGTNLFDQQYSEIGSIPMPGRWLRIGFSVNPNF